MVILRLKKALIYVSEQKDIGFVNTKRVIHSLAELGVRSLCDKKYRTQLSDCDSEIEYIDENDSERIRDVDFIITLGGDGTIIRAARLASPHEIPIVGVNLGRVGYLAEVEPNELELFGRLISGEYTIADRMMLDAKIYRGQTQIGNTYTALNDIVVSNGMISRLVELELSCDGCEVSKYRADGLIASTPTGSTAYSMSAGGAVVDPKLRCICLTPVCSHSLGARPLVFSAESVLTITNKSRINDNIYMTVDGIINTKLELDDRIEISRSSLKTKLVKLKKDNFYNVLHSKISESQ